MDLYDIQNRAKELYIAIFSLEDILSHRKRKVISQILAIITALIFVIWLMLFLSYSFLGLTGFDSILLKVRGAGYLFFTLWMLFFASNAFFYSYYFKKPGEDLGIFIDLDLAYVSLKMSPKDITGSFFNSVLGSRFILRTGISNEAVQNFLNARVKFLTADNFKCDPKDNVIDLVDFVGALYECDPELQRFLFAQAIQKKDWLSIAAWIMEIHAKRHSLEGWWSKENLARFPSVGQGWSYGEAYTLKKYQRFLPFTSFEKYGVHTSYGEKEYVQLQTILAKNRQGNALLVSDDFSGQLQLIARLEQDIINNVSLEELKGKKVMVLDVEALVSIGAGASSSITSRIQSLGSNLILVSPGAQRSQGFGVNAGRGGTRILTMEDVKSISSVENVLAVTGEVSGRYQVTAKGTNTNTTVNGVSPSYTTIRNVSVEEGSFIDDTSEASIAKVAVIGPTVVTDLFGESAVASDAIGQIIRIKGSQFKVIGVTVAKGGTGFANPDDIIFVPISSAQRYLSGNQYVTSIDIQANSPSNMTTIQADVTTLLLSNHKISDPSLADFSVLNQNDILSTASSVTDTLTYLLGAIAGISLLVGGIGIMNMMLTTVTERTREIGLRKAIGAKKTDISKQFLVEATALTLIGGVIGIALGWGISFLVNYLGIISTSISLSSILLAFGVSAVIGIVFGYYPARRAAALNPIEALRYE